MRLPPDAVEDVVQETLLAAVRAMTQWHRRASFATWTAGILRYKIADYYRVQKSTVMRLEALEALHPDQTTDHIVDVRLILDELQPQYYTVLRLRFTDGLSFADIAQELGVSLEAAKSRYRRAMAHFREAWDA